MLTKKVPDVMSSLLWKILSMEEVWEHCLLPEPVSYTHLDVYKRQNGTLDQIDLQFEDNAAVCVVLASDGYPVKYDKGLPITGLEEFDKHDGYYCFHAGTKFDGDQILSLIHIYIWR